MKLCLIKRLVLHPQRTLDLEYQHGGDELQNLTMNAWSSIIQINAAMQDNLYQAWWKYQACYTRLSWQLWYTHVVTRLSQSWQGCNNIVTSWVLELEQPCNESDSLMKLVTRCYQSVPNLFQQLRKSSENTTCEQVMIMPVTTCLLVSNNCRFLRTKFALLSSMWITLLRVYYMLILNMH